MCWACILGTGVDLPVVTFRDDDDPADVLRAQRKARNRAPFVVLRMPSVLEEGDIEAGDDLSTRMRKKAAARLRKKGTRVSHHFHHKGRRRLW